MEKSTLSPKQSEFLTNLDEIGWFDSPQNIRTKIEKRLADSDDSDLHLLLNHFSFMHDDFQSLEEFKQLFRKVEKVTELNILSMDFVMPEGSRKLEITINTEAKIHKMDFDLNDEYIATEVIESLNHLAEDFELESNFLFLPLESEICFIVFAPIETYMKAVKKGIIPEDEVYIDSLYEEYDIAEERD